MRNRAWEDYYPTGETSSDYRSAVEGRLAEIAANGAVIETHANGPTITGSIGSEAYDLIPVELVANQTYTWSYRGIVDPLLGLVNSDLTAFLAVDDDGGLGRSSQITFTPTEGGTYYLYASSWYHEDPEAPGYPTYRDSGDYTIVQWSPEAGHDAGGSIATAGTIDLGTSYAYFEAAFDQDFYAIELTAGEVYSFTFNGGVSSGSDWDDEPGESIGVLGLYDSTGAAVVPLTVDYETGITFLPTDSGTYYLRVVPYSSFGGVPGPEMTGGYTLDIVQIDPSTRDPLEALNWDSAFNIETVDVDGVPTATVYFAAAGENFGETEPTDDHPPGTPMATYGWEQHQIDAVMHALNTQYTPITGINYVITDNPDEATFRLLTTINDDFGARFYPNAPEYGDAAGIGIFNLASGGFGIDPNSLLPGGFSYAVILHEFGHAHGVAHPHDTGGGSEVMLGVSGSASLGLFDLNQGVYTVMSYNDGWITHPDGERVYSPANRGSGWSETLGAFDIAVLQARYGEHANNDGNTVYQLTDVQADASYQTIWDTSGSDTIAYGGSSDVQIDLLAATLDYTPTGGGVVSFVDGVWGGYTIANGVVIENATGGSGDDVLLGNSADNVLTGNDGNDALMGRAGNDQLFGGAGDDILDGGAGNDQLFGGAGTDTFQFSDWGTDRIVGYEAGETIDLSGLGVSMDDVRITRAGIMVDLDGPKDLLIQMDTRGFDSEWLYFGEEASATSSVSHGGSANADYLFG